MEPCLLNLKGIWLFYGKCENVNYSNSKLVAIP